MKAVKRGSIEGSRGGTVKDGKMAEIGGEWKAGGGRKKLDSQQGASETVLAGRRGSPYSRG